MFNLKSTDPIIRKMNHSVSPQRHASHHSHKKNYNKTPQYLQQRSQTPGYKGVKPMEGQVKKTEFRLSSQQRRQEQQDFTMYLDKLIKEMTERKQKLEKFIKIFNLMQSHNAQIRCLDHSNILTIYCQTERKTLCANCVYGFNRHKTHKLLPLKDANEFIREDNNYFWVQINEDLKKMDESIKSTQDTTILLQKQLKKRLKWEQEEHVRKSDDLRAQYERKRTFIQKFYLNLIDKSKVVERIVQEFKIKIWEILSKIGIGKHGDGSNIDFEVGKQVTCVSMASITKFAVKAISKRDLDKIHHKFDRL